MAPCKTTLIFLLAAIFFTTEAEKSGKESTFCCDVALEEVSVDVIKVKPVKKSRMEEKEVVIGYKDCGIVGQSVCPIYDYVWDEVIYYAMDNVLEKETYTMPCPDKHVVCCKGYEKFHDNCYKPEEIGDLKKLEALGIL